MLVKAIVVTYNGVQWIDRCLDSLRGQGVPVKTIVVDNGSTDGTVEAIRSRFPEVELHVTGENLGFGKANNIGMRMALDQGADHAFLLNQDAWLVPDALGKLVAAAAAEKQYGILSPIQLNGTGSALDLVFSHYIGPRFQPKLFSDMALGLAGDHVYPIKFVNAAAWLVTRACLLKVGGFSPSFFHYGEDDNYVHRLHYHGLQIGVVADSQIYHDREERVVNPYFDDIRAWNERKALVEFSDPTKMLDPRRQKLFLLRQLGQRLFSAQRSEARDLRERLRAVNALPTNEVLKNRTLSMQAGACFL
ncbi:MAG: glycosyltransferase family 2 protein [Flavobacteriales bacterium]|nr:glycosyltransferase family 2 protein [Flavobacteriales bacterium]